MTTATLPRFRVINTVSHSCDTCGRQLCDCACPVNVKCIHCKIDAEDAEDWAICESLGGHEWRDEEGDRVAVDVPRGRAIPARPENPPVRVLPKHAYRGLRDLAEGLGGIGYGPPYEGYYAPGKANYIMPREEWGEPIDALAMLERAIASRADAVRIWHAAKLFDDEADNYAPRRIIQRLGIPFRPSDPWPRFPFAEWCRELNIVEGSE